MGTCFTQDNSYIFDDIVLDHAEKFYPKTKKILKVIRKMNYQSEDKWRGLVLMYKAFKVHNWIPEPDVVLEEHITAIASIVGYDKYDEWHSRLDSMKNEMLESLKPKGSKRKVKNDIR